MKRILCYGDSNTWGYDPAAYNPATGMFGRYAYDVRWTGRLQSILGSSCHVVEEAYNGRTTCFSDPSFPGRNALEHFYVSFYSHEPLDLVVIMLGTNDVKDVFSAQACVIGWGLERLIRNFFQVTMTCLSPNVQLLAVCPPELLPMCSGQFFGGFSPASQVKSKQLPEIYKDIAKRYQCGYLNASAYVRASDIDGIHMDPDAHAVFAEIIAEKIKKMLGFK
jgi:lysophospholipase L1-like esterase